jgi:hypothetical protein
MRDEGRGKREEKQKSLFVIDGSKSVTSTQGTLQSGEEITPDVIARTYSIKNGTAVTQANNNQVREA